MSDSDGIRAGAVGIVSSVLAVRPEACDSKFPLMGGSEPIDSMALVEMCVQLEDYASQIGFEFDWTSSDALSRSSSIFKTFGTLFDEFSRQMKAQSS